MVAPAGTISLMFVILLVQLASRGRVTMENQIFQIALIKIECVGFGQCVCRTAEGTRGKRVK